ncbi:MAG TPA: WbqC family protein [Candidatus Hydrogenedentes bacterium]|nr:WbqC family protein [Candidatus Hydrogenedentota bacterium]HPC15071.1 WbqC family protein [Candidatus Hydrogenedentota bacterium]HRT19068.1 WbqC family protein [Candidatus Hydrogenedentota bacterium]HRT63997.1 WbqC family protein [Candidatus Hydrogenedentota bacterium]
MRVSIHQPHYLPWLRYFDKIARSDVFIVLDTIQYNKNGWQNRNRIKTAHGPLLLTVPVFDRFGQSLDDVRIDNEIPWARKHLRSIEQAYRGAPFFAEHAAFLHDVYQRDWTRLNDLNFYMLGYFLAALGIRTRILRASELHVPGTATERLVQLVRAAGGDRYFSGAYAVGAYLDASLFANAGIVLEWQQWTAPVYPQRYGPFEPDLSIIDLLFNCGPQSLDILLGGRA